MLASKERRNDSTIDNNATTTQLKYLARLYKAHPADVWRDAFARGME